MDLLEGGNIYNWVWYWDLRLLIYFEDNCNGES